MARNPDANTSYSHQKTTTNSALVRETVPSHVTQFRNRWIACHEGKKLKKTDRTGNHSRQRMSLNSDSDTSYSEQKLPLIPLLFGKLCLHRSRKSGTFGAQATQAECWGKPIEQAAIQPKGWPEIQTPILAIRPEKTTTNSALIRKLCLRISRMSATGGSHDTQAKKTGKRPEQLPKKINA